LKRNIGLATHFLLVRKKSYTIKLCGFGNESCPTRPRLTQNRTQYNVGRGEATLLDYSLTILNSLKSKTEMISVITMIEEETQRTNLDDNV
jgi:hypothetical protein